MFWIGVNWKGVHTSDQFTAFIPIFFSWQLFCFWWNIWLLSSLFVAVLEVLQKCSAHSLLYLEQLASPRTSSGVFLLQQFPLMSNSVLKQLAYLSRQKKITKRFWLNWQFAELWCAMWWEWQFFWLYWISRIGPLKIKIYQYLAGPWTIHGPWYTEALINPASLQHRQAYILIVWCQQKYVGEGGGVVLVELFQGLVKRTVCPSQRMWAILTDVLTSTLTYIAHMKLSFQLHLSLIYKT